jgi:hypothetical protein
MAQFSRRKGVSGQRLAYWRKRLASTGPTTPAFLSVALPVAPSPASAPRIEILVGGVTVRVREDLEAEKLADIIALMARGAAGC